MPRKSTRLSWYDYSTSGAYFVTVNVKNRQKSLGQLTNKAVVLSESGKIVEQFWRKVPTVFPFSKLGAFIIMPDHFHGIVFIAQDDEKRPHPTTAGGVTGNKNPMLHNDLPKIMRWFKERTAKEIKKSIEPLFKWQDRYYDSIIRTPEGLGRVSRYIENNAIAADGKH